MKYQNNFYLLLREDGGCTEEEEADHNHVDCEGEDTTDSRTDLCRPHSAFYAGSDGQSTQGFKPYPSSLSQGIIVTAQLQIHYL